MRTGRGGGAEGKRGGRGEETTRLHGSQSPVTFPARLSPLATLALPAELRLTGGHLPVRSSSGAPHSETKEDYRHYAAQHDKESRPF